MTVQYWMRKRTHFGLVIFLVSIVVEPLSARDLALGAYQITYELAQRSFSTTLVVNRKLPGKKGSYQGFEYDTKQPFFATVTGSQMCAVPPSTGIQSFSYCFTWPTKKTNTAQTLVITCSGEISTTLSAKCVGDSYPASVKRVELEGLPNP
jgi:hypothetical protein